MKVYHNIQHDLFLQFDTYFIDIWGVLHQGGVLFPGVLKSLEFLKSHNKQILLLSNAPRRAKKVESFLSGIGVKNGQHFDNILTSGEAFFLSLDDESKNTDSNLVFYI